MDATPRHGGLLDPTADAASTSSLDALAAHRTSISTWRRGVGRAPALHALADFATEHGERGLRALGGRREAERWLAEQDPGLDAASLAGALERRAGHGKPPGERSA